MVILSYCYDRKCEVIRSWLEEDLGLSPEDKARKCEVIRALEISILQEEISWRQKSRVHWLKEGDKCTKFFLRIANSNRRSNAMESLTINGSNSSDQQVIRNHVAHFYESLFSEPYSWRLGWITLFSTLWMRWSLRPWNFLLRKRRSLR